MMKKRIIGIVLIIAVLIFTFSGCSLFSSESDNDGTEKAKYLDGVEITEKFTLHTPEQFDCDMVYPIKCPPAGDNLADEYNKECGLLAMWIIVYAKGDELVGESVVYVLPDQAGVDYMIKDLGGDPDRYIIPDDEFVMISTSDKDYLDGTVVLYQSMGDLPSQCKAIDYVNLMASLLGGALLE